MKIRSHKMKRIFSELLQRALRHTPLREGKLYDWCELAKREYTWEELDAMYPDGHYD